MLSIVKSIALHGLDGYLVDVQVDVSSGMPSWEIVGLPDISIKEAKERIKAAIKNSGMEFNSRKITINMAPASLRKEGSCFDLSMAVGILIATEYIKKSKLEDTIFIGELSLDGRLNKVNGILPMCIEAYKNGIKRIILPEQNKNEGAIIEDLEIIGVKSLCEVVKFLNGEIEIKKSIANKFEIFNTKNNYEFDFSEVKGQENIKRALEIVAAGGHNCILIGSPGSGKTMMAKRIPSILPDLSFEEALEITKIYSIAGILPSDVPIVTKRQFRSPHHTISPISLIGGGKIPKPGEISLSHYGVLFLDELPEFARSTLEVLRGPLEDRQVTISRLNASLTYPCNFMLIASMNPCPCRLFWI